MSKNAGKNDYGLFVAFILLYFAFLAGVTSIHGRTSHYQLLADAFLAGQTHLLTAPDPQLLALPDPYDSVANQPYRLHDALLYQGKYYLFYGPVPAILLFVPFKWLTGEHLGTIFVTWLFISIGTTALAVLFLTLTQRLGIFRPHLALMCFAVIALGTFIPYTIRRSEFYEIALSGAYCFSVLGMSALFFGFERENTRHRWFMAASLCFGLAAGCRAHFVLAGAALFITAWYCHRQKKMDTKILSSLFLPWVTCGALLAGYNFIRFGSLFELGTHYLVTCVNCHVAWNIRYVPSNLYEYLIKPIPVQASFPFFNLYCCGENPSFGLLGNSPFIVWLAFFPLLLKRAAEQGKNLLPWFYAVTLASCIIFVTLLFFSFSTQRYRVDFAPWWMLFAALSYLVALKEVEPKKNLYRLVLGLGILTAAYSLTVGLITGLVGENGAGLIPVKNGYVTPLN